MEVDGLVKFSGILSGKVLMILMILFPWISRCVFEHCTDMALEVLCASCVGIFDCATDVWCYRLYIIVVKSINNRQFKYWFWPLVKKSILHWSIPTEALIDRTFWTQWPLLKLFKQKKWNKIKHNSHLLCIYLGSFRPILLVSLQRKWGKQQPNRCELLIQSHFFSGWK